MSARDWSPEEAAQLAAAAPEFAGMTRAEFETIAKRYGKSDPSLRALLSGKATAEAIREARDEAEEERIIAARFPSMRRK